jgi:glc operon protein GlcG
VWEDLIKDRPVMMKFPDNLPIQGGMPITAQGECVGAIGVSGVQSHQDEQVASAGIAALK